MSGFEAAGVALAVPAIVAQLLKVSKEGYDLFQNAQAVPEDVQRWLHSMNVSRVQLGDWEDELSRCGGDLAAVINPTTPRYRLVLQTLVMIAGVFAEVRQLEEKYGISRVVKNEPAAARVELTEGNPAGKERLITKLANKVQRIFSRQKPANDDIRPTPAMSSAPASFNTSVETSLVPASLSMSGKAVWHVAESLSDLELDNQIPGLAECVREMAAKVEEYKNTIPQLRKYQWAYSSGEKLLLLVKDLEKYISHLQVLTKDSFSRLNIVIPIDEFHVEINLPFAKLGNFSGREDTLEEMKSFLSPTLLEKGRLCDRTVVVLQGMGGIGKSQIALEYIYRNLGDYSAVFWIDATNSNTVKESGREIMESLIAHYAKRHPGGMNFADVAIDLCIPGQITSEGVLSDRAAKAAWTSVRHWLARDGNRGWCLVVDGLNNESDTERMQKLLPRCAYGHVIATSRVTAPGYKSIEIPVLDKESGVKLLLNDQVETKISEIQHAAEQIANLLGYLPLALAQAAAFVKKRVLSLVDYLRRLERDLTRYVSSPFPPYENGVFSCWEMSARAVMESTPHAVDLLRICSFLSPDGISRELLCRGLEAMDWFQNDESRLDDALDNLVMYALMKRKHSNTVKGDIFSIHPLVQRLARETHIEGNSVVLVAKSEQRERLRRAAELKAISLVGCGLKTAYDNREACEWVFERRNMGHISLCLEKYLPECDRELQDGVADEKLAKALTNFAGLKFYWGEYSDSQRIVKSSIEAYERTLPSGGDPSLEAELLMAKQQLLGIWITRHVNADMGEVGRLIDETLSRQSAILRPEDVHLLWTQSMNATYFARTGRKWEAVKLFRECMEKNQKALQPGNPVNMATTNNFATLCCQLGMEEEATQLYEKSKELYLQHRGANHQDTHIVLNNIAGFKAQRGDVEGALECYKIVAEGSESTYGLANRDTVKALRTLAHQYQRAGCKEEAVQVERKITKGREILEDASKLDAPLDEEDDLEEE